MLYIHQLNHLTPKKADLESVYLVRDLKMRTPYPLTSERVQEYLSNTFLSDTDREAMLEALFLVDPTLDMLKQLLMMQDSTYEQISLQRAIQILTEMPHALEANIRYAKEMLDWQKEGVNEIVPLFNRVPKLRTSEEKVACNQQVNTVFQRILRNEEFGFFHNDIVNEAHVAHINDLHESVGKGFLFHITLEEELKKIDADSIKKRLPAEKVNVIEQIENNVLLIKRGLERAYDGNMHMVNLALVLYAYMKWLTNKDEFF